MANLITNRHKRQEHGERPTVFTKRQSSRRLRRNSLDDAIDDKASLPHRPTKHANRKKSGVCPICLARLAKNSKKNAIRTSLRNLQIPTQTRNSLYFMRIISRLVRPQWTTLQGLRKRSIMAACIPGKRDEQCDEPKSRNRASFKW